MTLHLKEFADFQPDTPTQTKELDGPRRVPSYGHGPKRALDISLIVVSLPVTLPLVVIVALLVMLDGGAPFFRQWRVGWGGHNFRLLKLRTMVPDADRRLMEHLEADPAAREEWDTAQKLRNDPRITAIGKFLRKSSLDELPQLFNVLVGDMSLIGPRPMLPEQKALYPGMAYFSLRPGITGLWQVSDRNDSSFADRAQFDAAYKETLSLGGDMAILGRTVGVVLRGTGC